MHLLRTHQGSQDWIRPSDIRAAPLHSIRNTQCGLEELQPGVQSIPGSRRDQSLEPAGGSGSEEEEDGAVGALLEPRSAPAVPGAADPGILELPPQLFMGFTWLKASCSREGVPALQGLELEEL